MYLLMRYTPQPQLQHPVTVGKPALSVQVERPRFDKMQYTFIVSTALLIAYLSFHLARTWRRLCHIPGPRLAAFSDLWRWYIMNSQGYGERMVQLHRRYGPVVRMGPDRVSVSDPAAVHVTHGTRPVWEKVRIQSCAGKDYD